MLKYFEYSDRKINTESTAYASERLECMLSMLPRSGFDPCATIFPTDEVITQPPPDCILDFFHLLQCVLVFLPEQLLQGCRDSR